MAEWWWHTDRRQQLEALRSLIPGGGCLVLAGSDQAGREIALRLVIDRLQEFQYSVAAVAAADRPSSAKRSLLAAWQLLVPPPPPHVIPPWVTPGLRMPLPTLVRRIADVIREQGEPRALVFEEVDAYDPLQAAESEAFVQLADEADCPVVVTSRAEARTPWPRGDKCTLSLLNDFSEDDVLRVLMHSPAMRGRDLGELQDAAAFITGGAASIRPNVAYARMCALSEA